LVKGLQVVITALLVRETGISLLINFKKYMIYSL